MASMVDRMMGAARLDAQTFEEIEADESAIGQAMGVVMLAAVAAGIGGLRSGTTALFAALFAAVVGWAIWAAIVFVVGTKILPEPQTKADFPEVLRTIGFAATPGLLNVFGIIPFLGMIVGLVAALWQLAAMVVAVRQVLDYQTTGKAVIVCLLGWVAYIVVAVMLAAVFGISAGAHVSGVDVRVRKPGGLLARARSVRRWSTLSRGRRPRPDLTSEGGAFTERRGACR